MKYWGEAKREPISQKNYFKKVQKFVGYFVYSDLGESVHVAAMRPLLELIESEELHSIYMQC